MADWRVDFGVVRVSIPDGATTTLETSEVRPPVRRYFVDLVVVAISTEPAELTDVGSALGDVIATYVGRPGYERTVVVAPDVPGATEADALDFVWSSDLGVEMRSLVVAASDGQVVACVHASHPTHFGKRCRPIADEIMASLQLVGSGSR